MKRILVTALVLLWTAPAWAQDDADYQKWMKEVFSSVQSLKKNLDGGDGAAASGDAKKLAGVFAQVHEFWMKRKADDASELATAAQEGFGKVAGLAAAGNVAEASTAFKTATSTCKGCHDLHRQKAADGSWKIK